MKPNRTLLDLYEQVLVGITQDARKEIRTKIETLRSQLSDKRKQIEEVEDLMINDRTHADRYTRILARYEKEAYDLETRIEIMRTQNWRETKPKLHYVISLINNMVMYIRDAPLEVKIKLIGLIFPEKLEFDGKNYRTKNMNKLVDLIHQQTSELRGNHKKKRRTEIAVLPFSAPNRALLEPIWGDLDRLWEMRFWIPNPGEPISPQSFHHP